MEKTKRTELVGRVVSDKNDKTITVLVETYKKDSDLRSDRGIWCDSDGWTFWVWE